MKIVIQFEEDENVQGNHGKFLALILRNWTINVDTGGFFGQRSFRLEGRVVQQDYHAEQPPMPADIATLPASAKLLDE